jgi:hypothetical protein
MKRRYSACEEEKYTCPRCQKEGKRKIYSLVVPQWRPDLKQRLLDQTIFDKACPDCNIVLHRFYPLTYHDLQHQTMLHLLAENNENLRKNQLLAKELEKLFTKDYQDKNSIFHKLYREFYTEGITNKFYYKAVYSLSEMRAEIIKLDQSKQNPWMNLRVLPKTSTIYARMM